jgi:hypothetical protein
MVHIMANDNSFSDHNFKLRVTIDGVGITIRTKPSFIPQPLIVQGGAPLIVYGEDIAEYFHPDNLDFSGLTKKDYEKTGKLPEGVYRFTIEVVDYNRGTVLSNKGTTVAWIILNDPPILNLPRKDSKIQLLDPTNIPFTWTPRHTSSPNSAFTTEYQFRLIEIWPLDRNPYDAFLTQPTLYETTTSQTQLLYGLSEPALLPGRKYAWQVQARDIDNKDLFKNQGRSEVFVFQFGDALGMPENVRLQSANPSTLTIRWDQSMAGSATPLKSRVRYRPHNNRTHDDWYEAVSDEQWKAIMQLQPGTEYEVQVRAEQVPQLSAYTTTQIFKTLAAGENQFVCKSDVPIPPAPAAGVPVFPLSINDTITAAGYKVLVREVTKNGNTYTGRGVAIVPWFASARVRVTFENISVNPQFWLTSGEIKTVWDANSKFLKKIEGNSSGNGPRAGEIPVGIVATDSLIRITGAALVSVTKDADGNIVVQTSDGQTRVLEKNTSYSIVDEVGTGYVVDKQGNIVKTTAAEAMAANERGNRTYDIKLKFEKGNGVFGFDEKQHEALAQYYQQIDNGSIAWKGASYQQDYVYALPQGTNLDLQKVVFELDGEITSPTITDNKFKITLNGKQEGTVEELLAYEDNTKKKVIGKLNVVSYSKINRTVVLIPVNNKTYPYSTTELKTKLNEIYGQAATEWAIREEANLAVPLGAEFDDGESGLLSNYSVDMKKVINAYTQNRSLATDTYYLFLVANPKSKTKLGYMPRKKQAGFIFVDKLGEPTAVNTIAHELAHGAFRLEHTFSEFPALTQGITKNLMDYPAGVELYKYQWDNVHNPVAMLSLFDGDDDGASKLPVLFIEEQEFIISIPTEAENTPGYYTYVTPSGHPITLHSSVTPSLTGKISDGVANALIPKGVLLAFKSGTTEYVASFTYLKVENKLTFLGYEKKGAEEFYSGDILSASLPSTYKVIIAKENDAQCTIDLGIANYSTAYIPITPKLSQPVNSSLNVLSLNPQFKSWSIPIVDCHKILTVDYQRLINEGRIIVNAYGNGVLYSLKEGNITRYIYQGVLQDGNYAYQEWDGANWHAITLQLPEKINPVLAVLSIWKELLTDPHFMLDAVGSAPIPVVGELADGLNGVIYYIEGDNTGMYLSMAGAAVPVAGDIIKNTFRAAKTVIKGRLLIKYSDEFVAEMNKVYDHLRNNTTLSSEQFLTAYKNINTLAIKHGPEAERAITLLAKSTTDKTQFVKAVQKIKDLEKTNADKVANLFSDITSSTSLAEALVKNDALVDAWKKLDDAGLTALRKDPNWLNRVKGWTDDGLNLTSEGKILNNGSEVGKIVGDRLHVKYSGLGGDIVCDPDKTTTILGKWKDPSCGGTCEVIDSRLSKSGQNRGGVNVLSENIPASWTDQQIWDDVNEPWLRDAASRSDVIRVVSDPTKTTNIYKQGTELSFFGREHELLTKPVSQGGLGYTYNPSTFTYTK